LNEWAPMQPQVVGTTPLQFRANQICMLPIGNNNVN